MALFPLGILSAAGAGDLPAYELVSTTLITTNTASVVFDTSSLGSTYRHLQIRAVARTSNSDNNGFLGLRINGDTTSNYNEHYLYQDLANSIATSFNGAFTSAFAAPVSANSNVSNAFGGFVMDILDFASTTKNTTSRSLGGFAGAAGSEHRLSSGLHRSTAAVSSITIFERAYSGNLMAGSRFSLYGIR
jgi:hypothetical protein